MNNRNQSEGEYLSSYDFSKYEKPSVTTDIVAFMIRSEENENYKMDSKNRLSILLVKRAVHPFLGSWALPGGFLRPDETMERCAFREITEEAGVTPTALMPIGVFSEPKRDPRGWIISNAYASIISEESVKQVGGDDASDAQWFDIDFAKEEDGSSILTLSYEDIKLQAVIREEGTKFGRTSFRIEQSGGIAFDHAGIIATALTALREVARNYETLFDFLPERFTLSALQRVQETILNIQILPANFRRKVSEYVVETDEYTQGAGHRPAKLYRKK